MAQDENSFLMGGGVPGFKFSEIGATVKGKVVSTELQQQRDYDDQSKLLFWDDGSPRQQLKVVLASDERDPQIADDEGHRAIFVKGQLQTAVRDAVRAAGAKGLEVGGTLAVRYDSDGLKSNPRHNPPKIYKAKYEVPVAAAVSVEDF